MRVLITGATGFIGRHLVPTLLANHDITLLLREEYGSGKQLPEPLRPLRPQLEVVYADLRNFQITSRAVREAQPEAVMHLAAAGVTDPFLPISTALSHNLNGTLNLVRACFERGSGPDRLIVARTPGEASALNVYAASKAAAWSFCEMYARTAAWPILGAMVFQAYGPGQAPHLLVPAALRAALAGDQFPMTSGRQTRDWVHVDDVVGGLDAMLARPLAPGTTVDLGTGELTSLLRVVEMVYELVDRGGGPVPGALPDRPGEVAQPAADNGRSRELLGWEPRIGLSDGLAALVAAALEDELA